MAKKHNHDAEIRYGVEMIQAATIKRAGRHMNAFVRQRCAVDLLRLGLYPNAKEITESMACLYGALDYADFKTDNADVVVYVVGDGCTPRTAALFAFRSRARVVSIDPKLRGTWPIERLSLYGQRVETWEGRPAESRILVVLPHAHVEVDQALDSILPVNPLARVDVVALPCCVPQKLARGREPSVTYQDHACWSPRNEVRIWRAVPPLVPLAS